MNQRPGKSRFCQLRGKGSHLNYEHLTGGSVTGSGKLENDAKKYQEKEVQQKIEKVELLHDMK